MYCSFFPWDIILKGLERMSYIVRLKTASTIGWSLQTKDMFILHTMGQICFHFSSMISAPTSLFANYRYREPHKALLTGKLLNCSAASPAPALTSTLQTHLARQLRQIVLSRSLDCSCPMSTSTLLSCADSNSRRSLPNGMSNRMCDWL